MANSLSSVTLPSSLTELSLEAFLNSGMSEVTLPLPEEGYISSWENRTGAVFYGGDIVPVGDSYTRTSYKRIFEYIIEDEFLKLIKISAYNGIGGDVVIPSTIDGYSVYGIGYCAFADKGITSVTLPDCLMFLETGVFVSNPRLASFNLPGAYKGYLNGWYEYKTGTIKHSCGNEVTDMDANFRAEYELPCIRTAVPLLTTVTPNTPIYACLPLWQPIHRAYRRRCFLRQLFHRRSYDTRQRY